MNNLKYPEQMQCPACKNENADIFNAAVALRPCPYCGLTGAAGMDIRSIQVSTNGPGLRAQAIAQRIQLDVAERNLRTCQLALVMIRDHIVEMGEVAGPPEG